MHRASVRMGERQSPSPETENVAIALGDIEVGGVEQPPPNDESPMGLERANSVVIADTKIDSR